MLRASLGETPASVSRLLAQVPDICRAAKDVVVCRECFAQLSSCLERIQEIFDDVQEASPDSIHAFQTALQPLAAELQDATELINICTSKSRFFLLLNCHAYMKRVQDLMKSIGLALSQIPVNGLELSLQNKSNIEDLCQKMQGTQLRTSTAEEDLSDEVESGVRHRWMDSDHANNLLSKFAKVAGIPLDPSSLKLEFEELRKEKDSVELEKHQMEVFQLEHIISLLSCADALSSATERENQYQEKRNGLGSLPLPPLQTFYCPITQDVMENPVEIASGQTFEMSAIQKWFAEGHNVCPVTKIELQSTAMSPNRLLQQSIEEWKDRNTMIRLAAMSSRLKSENEEEKIEALLELQALCEEKSLHKHWIAAEGLISVLVGLLRSSKRDVRKKTLTTLNVLVAGNQENRVRICDAGAIDYAVRSLARDAGEVRQAVALLLQLCKDECLCEQISKVQSCILLLVTTASSEHAHAAADAKEILSLFTKSSDNVILMAEANYFQPLVHCLEEGSNTTQILMATALSRMQLTDHNRALLVQRGILASLVKMASSADMEAKSAALGAFRNLSILPENRDPMIKAGVVQPLLELLFTVKSIVTTTREHAAAIFANLAMSSEPSNIGDLWGNHADTDEAIFQLLALLNLTGPSIQCHILRALNCICGHSASVGVRATLREGSCIQLLIRFIDMKDAKNSEVRLYALKLLYHLTQDGGGEILADEMGLGSFKVLVDSFSGSLEEEKVAAMGILSNLPINNRQVTQTMVQAGVLSSIVTILKRCYTGSSGKIPNSLLVENATATLIRFTLQTDLELQQYTAEHDTIPLLVNLLSSGTQLTKCRAAMSLEQFSASTIKLSVPSKKTGGWCCWSAPPDATCRVHRGVCSVKGTFCLLESDAIAAFIQILEEREEETDEAALGALATLVYDECWERGSDAIVEAKGIMPIIRKLTSGSAGVQEKALWILERLLRKDKYRSEYGSVAQMPLVSLTQDSTNAARPLAAKILAHLNILHDQSSYF